MLTNSLRPRKRVARSSRSELVVPSMEQVSDSVPDEAATSQPKKFPATSAPASMSISASAAAAVAPRRLRKRSKYSISREPWLIHVGKSGGTTVASATKLGHSHDKPPPHRKVVLWLRNPISRFVSAFNFAKAAVAEGKRILKMSKRDIEKLSLENSPFPERLRRQWTRKASYTYTKIVDNLINRFPSVNSLLEALTSKNIEERRYAEKLMGYTCSNKNFAFFKSLGWYLDNGDWVPNNRRRVIFVGTLENMDNDVREVQRILKLPVSTTVPFTRKMSGTDISLTQKGFDNLLTYLEHTDYKALRALVQANLISEELYQSYRTYDHIAG